MLMTKMWRRVVLSLIFICYLTLLNAQKKGFYEGYIIEHSGDTVRGYVKDRSPEPFVSLYDKIRFKEGGRSRTKKYGPEDILGYGYQNQDFVSMRLREESSFFKFRYYADPAAPMVFLKVIERSERLVYFEQLFVHDDNDYLDAFPLFYRPGSNEMVRVTRGIFGFRKKRLLEYFADCPALVKELSSANATIRNVPELYAFLIANCALLEN